MSCYIHRIMAVGVIYCDIIKIPSRETVRRRDRVEDDRSISDDGTGGVMAVAPDAIIGQQGFIGPSRPCS